MGVAPKGAGGRLRRRPPGRTLRGLRAAPVLLLAWACAAPFDAVADGGAAPTAEPPEMLNRAEVAEALRRAYPDHLRDRGVSGRVLVWCTVDVRGRVVEASVARGSGHPELDRAALEVARIIRFRPATNEGAPAEVRVRFPLTFRTR